MCHQNFRVNKRGLSPQPHGLGGLLLKNNSTEGGGEVEGEVREGGRGKNTYQNSWQRCAAKLYKLCRPIAFSRPFSDLAHETQARFRPVL